MTEDLDKAMDESCEEEARKGAMEFLDFVRMIRRLYGDNGRVAGEKVGDTIQVRLRRGGDYGD